jgi:hypothetical protein
LLTSVDGSAGVFKFQFLSTETDLLKFDLPVCFAAHRDVIDGVDIGTPVNSTEDNLTPVFL